MTEECVFTAQTAWEAAPEAFRSRYESDANVSVTVGTHGGHWIATVHRVEAVVYLDTGEPCEAASERPCALCHQKRITPPTDDDSGSRFGVAIGPDPCLGLIERVRSACCGHGAADGDCHVAFTDGSNLRGEDALRWFHKHGLALRVTVEESVRAHE